MPETASFTYDPELGPGYFVQVRSDFLRSRAFTPYAKLLYALLLTYAGEGVDAFPGQVRLAAESGIGERTVRKVLTGELIPAGLVSVQRRGQGRTNNYHLHKLPTLPPHSRPAPRAAQERYNVPLKSGPLRRSRPAPRAAEVESVETQTEQGEKGSELSPLDEAVMRRAGITPDEYRALRGQK